MCGGRAAARLPRMPRLTYANVASTLALFLALGGGAVYAADRIAKDSVTAREIAEDSVGRSEVKESAVLPTSTEVRDDFVRVAAGSAIQIVVRCERGEVATGGGWAHFPGAGFDYGQTQVEHDGPTDPGGTPTGWTVLLKNTASTEQGYIVYAVCAPGRANGG